MVHESKITLCKIAKVVEECTKQDFRFKDVPFTFLDVFKENSIELLEIIKNTECVKTEQFDFILQNDNLVLIYENLVQRRNRKVESVLQQMFNIVFAGYNKGHHRSLSEDENAENDPKESSILRRTYITTKLFKLLKTDDVPVCLISQLPATFLPTLCEYQKKTVNWLCFRERVTEKFPAYFVRLAAKDDETFVYKHLYSQYVQCEKPPDIILPPGGILAEEMGLGKTVEMLALILLNPRIDSDVLSFGQLQEHACTKRQCVREKQVFCTCVSSSQKSIVQCKKCHFWQHKKCVKKFETEEEFDPYLCPSCWCTVIAQNGLIKAKTTFIVSPNIIKLQWYNEIYRHTQPSLRVLLYNGATAGNWINPYKLAEYDIVLTDYNILRTEIYYTQENQSERTSRHTPRSIRVNSPLLMLNWWRVCLDEAQMVESNTSKVAALVRMLPAVNRWAVTGTPIQKSLNDLQPLLEFIGFSEAADKTVWEYLVKEFVSIQNSEQDEADLTTSQVDPELVHVLRKCMWRTCKTEEIIRELNIPSQEVMLHTIVLDNLEKLFYNEQHTECKSKFMENIDKYAKRMKTISPQVMKIILQPFLKIRQSCTMPVVVTNASSKKRSFTSTQQHKQFLQPQELHGYLKSTNELSCKSELRAMASSHNGLAALYWLQENHDESLKNYESVLKLAKEYTEMNITVDSLLQIHAIHNMMQLTIFKNSYNAELPSKCLETLELQYNALEWKYLETYSNTLFTVKTSYENALNKVDKSITMDFICSLAGNLESLTSVDGNLLLQKIFEECIPKFGNTNVKLAEIHSTRSLIYVLQLWFSKLSNSLEKLVEDFQSLKYFSENVRTRSQVSPAVWREIMQLVNTVYDCHLSEIRDNEKQKQAKSKTNEKKTHCKMCCLRDEINSLECLLFDKVIDKTSNFTEGLDNPSFEMEVCKLIFNFFKSKNNTTLEAYGSYLDNLQVLCKRLIKLWIEMEYTIKAYDELNMCKMRISLTEDPDDLSNFKILKHEIEGRILEQQDDLYQAQRQFTIKLARLRYIKHLEGDINTEPCPICRLSEDDRYAVLECGHHICFPCLQTVRQYNKKSEFKCSICRNIQNNENIYYVNRKNTKNLTSSDELAVKGNYSSKITHITRTILKLLSLTATDESTSPSSSSSKDILKIIIFSQWEPILNTIGQSLKENNISYRLQCNPKNIEDFKNSASGITCLLMPFIKGSKGLNLIEATHVFLVEPILNPGEELQAIGRVHRFGQIRQTTVHRFIVKDTIEENIYNFIKSGNSSGDNDDQSAQAAIQNWEFKNMKLEDFQNLFSLRSEEQEND